MIHRVGTAGWHFAVIDVKRIGNLSGALFISIQPKETRIEAGDVVLEDFWLIAFRINCDKDDLQATTIGTEILCEFQLHVPVRLGTRPGIA